MESLCLGEGRGRERISKIKILNRKFLRSHTHEVHKVTNQLTFPQLFYGILFCDIETMKLWRGSSDWIGTIKVTQMNGFYHLLPLLFGEEREPHPRVSFMSINQRIMDFRHHLHSATEEVNRWEEDSRQSKMRRWMVKVVESADRKGEDGASPPLILRRDFLLFKVRKITQKVWKNQRKDDPRKDHIRRDYRHDHH